MTLTILVSFQTAKVVALEGASPAPFLGEISQMPGVQKEALERLMEVKPLRVAAAW